jgi:hypothetical protein
VYLQGDYHLVSPCHYLDVRIKQKDSSSPLRLLLPQVRISLLLFCCEGGPATPNQGVQCVAVHTLVRRLDHSESCTVITCCSSSCAVSSLTALRTLNLNATNATNEVLRAVSSSLTNLTTLVISYCHNLKAEGLRALSSLTSLTNLNLEGGAAVTAEVLRAMSSLTGLTTLSLWACKNVTNEGLRAVIK